MNLQLQTIFEAPKKFRDANPSGKAWKDFNNAAYDYICEHHQAVIVAQTNQHFDDIATRYRWADGVVAQEAVRVTIVVRLTAVVAVSSPHGTFSNEPAPVIDETREQLMIKSPAGEVITFSKSTHQAVSPDYEGWSYR